MAIAFHDITTLDSNPGYVVTNESSKTLRAWAKEIKPARALAVCGSGDVPLLSILPYAGSVVAVDVSYHSLSAALLKAGLLEDFPPHQLPQLIGDRLRFAQALETQRLKYEGMPTFDHGIIDLMKDWGPTLRGIWGDVEPLEGAQRNLHAITFVHGDIKNLGQFAGQYDLVYASNIIGWASDRHAITLDDIAQLTAPGGHMMVATTHARAMGSEKYRGVDFCEAFGFLHQLYQKPGEAL